MYQKWPKLAQNGKNVFFVGFCRGVEISEGHEIFFSFSELQINRIKKFLLEFFHISKISENIRPR
jgi:hypothetical protein